MQLAFIKTHQPEGIQKHPAALSLPFSSLPSAVPPTSTDTVGEPWDGGITRSTGVNLKAFGSLTCGAGKQRQLQTGTSSIRAEQTKHNFQHTLVRC